MRRRPPIMVGFPDDNDPNDDMREVGKQIVQHVAELKAMGYGRLAWCVFGVKMAKTFRDRGLNNQREE